MHRLASLIVCALLAGCSGDITGSPPGGDGAAGAADARPGGSIDGGGGGGVDAAPGIDAAWPADEPAALRGITAAHNVVRAGVGVGPLTWQPALAATAQAWAEQCIDDTAPAGLIDHNPNRSVGHPYYVGENIYGSSGTARPQDAVDLWASEVADYDYASNTCAPGAVCGHYTQLVWAASLEVGCGIHTCPGLTYGSSIVCDYGPGGNDGGRPY